jgi:acyl dehydratase
VTAEGIAAYARATNDTDPRHLAGELAPPLFAVVPALRTLVRPRKALTEVHALHGEHDLVLHAPIRPGLVLRTAAWVHGIRPSPAGTIVVTRGETRDAGGRLLNEQYLTSVLRAEAPLPAGGDAAPDHRLDPGAVAGPPLARVTHQLDPDQTRRYAEASGDRDPYTFDDEHARRLGYPGAIVHGLCTLAFAGRAVAAACAGEDSTRVRRLAVRFARVLRMVPGQALTTVLWALGPAGAGQAFGFEATDREGTAVLTHGRAEVD